MKPFEYEHKNGGSVILTMKNINKTIFNYYVNDELKATGTRKEIAEKMNTKINLVTKNVYKTRNNPNKAIKYI
ncbi:MULTISPECIES: hypothetical protein [unclassified Bacillus cereus group]|uniref:hypothetical protein n=1 Tax=unclassified Bacillus cereus group TaxID=2750818 RepID=UPI0024C56954|nr:MAG: hypothetical protein NRZ52_15870 [Bacillus paranthracis]